MKKLIRITTVPNSLNKLLEDQLRFMNNHFNVIGISSEKDNMLSKISKKEGVPILEVKMSRKITPLKDLKSVFTLYKIFRNENPDIVHTHTPKAGIVGMLAAFFARVPLRLHTVAGMPLLEANGVKRKILNIVEILTYKCSTKVYPNSYELKKIIIKENFCKESKLKVIGNGSSNGIDTSFFDPNLYTKDNDLKLKKELGFLENDFIFIFVGRLVKDKGINELVSAFVDLQKNHKNIKLLLVGKFEEDLDPLNKITMNTIHNNNNINWVGYQMDVRPFFSISDVLTFPSYREGFPNVVLQAGAMNVPAIVTNINGCNEIITNNYNGYIVPVKNIIELKSKMVKMIENKTDFKKFISNQRKSIIHKYERTYFLNELLAEYQNLIKEVYV